MLRTSNPLLNDDAFRSATSWAGRVMPSDKRTVMTLQGAINASFILIGLCLIAGIFAWVYAQSHPGLVLPFLFGSGILGCVLTWVCCFKREASPYAGPVIAVCEGIFAGTASILWSAYAQKSSTLSNLGTGLVLQAGILTVGITLGMLTIYSTRIVKVTESFKVGVIAATMGICFVSVVSLVLSFFGIQVPYIWGNGIVGIGFSVFIVVIASLNLVLDFNFIEEGSYNGLPRHMEWYAAIGLLVTLVWLYVSILRLLAKLQSRR